jgi:site-specific DNA-methyltransferase (adenine-specific)
MEKYEITIKGNKIIITKDEDGFFIKPDFLKELEPFGTALKPSMELICLARKPLSEKSIAENVLKHGTGGINIDDCRVKYENTPNPATNPKYRKENGYKLPELGQVSNGSVQFTSSKNEINTEGRFPANTILECICDEVIPSKKGEIKNIERSRFGNGEYGKKDGRKTQPTAKVVSGIDNYNDKGDIHTNPECPCYILDKQSKGSSRFFYTAKVSKKERNMGLDEFDYKEQTSIGSTYAGNQTTSKLGGNPDKPTEPKKNNHPTVKPVNLMTYLCRLITPPNGVVLDMYMGSGSTGISALLEGFKFVGMEMDEDYFNIAEARINNFEQYRQFIKK